MDSFVSRARAERRTERRYIANTPSMVTWDGISQPAVIRDISAYGALLTGVYLPPVGTRITIIADHLEAWGTVIWLGADRCGVLLSSQVEPLEVIADPVVRTVERRPPLALALRQIAASFCA